jgi:tripartite motif-containing protein 71
MTKKVLHRVRLVILIVWSMSVLVASLVPARRAAAAYTDVVRTFHFLSQPYTGGLPRWLSTDSANNVYLSEVTSHKVYKGANGANFSTAYGTGASGLLDGDLNQPIGTMVAGTTLYVADCGNNRIQQFDVNTGTPTGYWGSSLVCPFGIARGPDGNLYVSDQNNRIVVFDTVGTYLRQFGSTGALAGQFNVPRGLVFDSLGYLYIADSLNNRIQKLSANGAYIREWGGLSAPESIAIDRANMIYVVDRSNKRFLRFDQRGNLIGSYAPAVGAVAGQFSDPVTITVVSPANEQARIYVGDVGNQRVDVFEAVVHPVSHNYQAKWGSLGSANGQFNGPYGIATDRAGNNYVADANNNRIQKFNTSGSFLTSWGSFGTTNGKFITPRGIAIDSTDSVYVADSQNGRIQKFTANGAYITQWGSPGSNPGQFSAPVGIASSDAGEVYIADSGNNRIQVFDLSGNYRRTWGTVGTGPGQLSTPGGIAYDNKRDLVFIVELGLPRVQVFSSSGAPYGVWAESTSGPCQLAKAMAIATDQRGDVYVVDRDNNRVAQFDDNGRCLGTIGSLGSGDGQFNSPLAVAVDRKSGQIFVTDEGNNCVQRFGSPNPKTDTVGVWRPSARTFFLRNSNTTGVADITVDLSAWALSGDKPMVGDWNGDGVDTVGVYRSGQFLLRESNTPGFPDYSVVLGIAGDVPIVGDWDGDGKDGVGVFRPSNGLIYLKNQLTSGVADYTMVLGSPGDKGLGGDWNADGQDSPGVYRPSLPRFFMSNKVLNGGVVADYSPTLGIGGDTPFTGDWVHQGSHGMGVFRPGNGQIYLRNALTDGAGDASIVLGIADDLPVAGQWGGAPGEAISTVAGRSTDVPARSPTEAISTKLAPTFVPYH